ncbi:acyl thioesterase [Fusarium sp. NRRL 25303]|nr:acyl thioesterase [Fusarium sp. NRRL 25303]
MGNSDHSPMDRDNGDLDLAAALQPLSISPQIFSVGPTGNLSPVYGGQLMGQAVMAAATDVGERQCHSVQATFIRRARPQDTACFNVAQDLAGNNFTIRHVNATQSDRGIFSAKVSFRKPRSEFEHQQPQKIASIPQDIDTIPQEGRSPRPPPAGIEVRWSRSVVDTNGNMELWMRTIQSLGDDSALHTAALLYASDYPILEAGLLRHGLSWQSTGLFTASLNHSAWFLRPLDFSDWHLFRIDSPAAFGGTALGRATCFDRQGNIVATFVQEAVMWMD